MQLRSWCSRSWATRALVLASLLGGCKVDGHTELPDGPDGGPEPAIVVAPHEGSVAMRFAASGVPHGAAISMVALDPSGRAAVTRDLAGGVRMWPTLDGTREPVVVPVRDPRAMALAADDAGGWTLALIDAAGGARIVGIDAAGKSKPLASVPPTEHIADIAVLPGGRRLVAVGHDHVIRLLDANAGELARIDHPGLRAASLRVTVDDAGQTHIAVVTAGEFDGKQARFAVEVLTLELNDEREAASKGPMSLTGDRQTVMLDSPPTIDNPSLSPDGRAIVYMQRQRLGGATWLLAAKQLGDGVQVSLDSQLGLGTQPRMGLLPRGRALLDDGSGVGRIVDLTKRKIELVPLRSTPTVNHLLTVFANGRRVGPVSNWLAIHELETDEMSYIGYEQLIVNNAAMSPGADAVAWSLSDRVAVERLAGASGPGGSAPAEVVEVPGTRSQSKVFVGFIDEQHLAMLDWNGGLQVVRWIDGEQIDSADLGANVNAAELRRAGPGNGVMLVRTDLWQNPVLVELLGGHIEGRYLTQGASNLLGLTTPRERELDDWGMWMLDGTSKLHTFTLAELREGIDASTALQHGQPFVPGVPEHMAIASDGTQFFVRTTGARPVLYAESGAQTHEHTLGSGFVVSLSPSPDARKIAVVQQRDPGQLLTIYAWADDTPKLRPLWSQPLPVSLTLSWSDAGEAIAVPANFGGVVFDTNDGSVEVSRCTLAFERRFTPPLFQGLGDQLSVCEL